MFRWMAAVLGLALFTCSGYAQAPGQTEPAGSQPLASQPTQPRTPQDVVRLADQAIGRVTALLKAGKSADAASLAGEAQRHLSDVLRADPTYVEARVVLAELLMLTRDFDQARALLKSVLQDEPSNFRANLAMGRFYLDSHYWRQATFYLKAAAKVAPPERQAEAWRLLSNSLAGEGNRAESVSTAEQAANADPSDVATLSNLAQMYLEAEQYDKALERANGLVEAARQAHEANLADQAALEQLIGAYQLQIKCLAGYYSTLCQRDSRGRPTDQLESGKEADAVRVLSDIAAAQEEIAKLNWELSYHHTLQIVEPVAGYQTEESRARLENNTTHLLTLAGLYWATHQTERAVEFFQRIVGLQKPSDADPAEARRNQDTAREFLQQHGFPLSAPAQSPAQP